MSLLQIYHWVCQRKKNWKSVNIRGSSVLWHCWLSDRKGIRPVKNWVVGCWRGYLSGLRCRLAYRPADATATHCLFASVKSRLVLPVWYWLTRVVPDKGPLNGCVCVWGSCGQEFSVLFFDSRCMCHNVTSETDKFLVCSRSDSDDTKLTLLWSPTGMLWKCCWW